MRSIWKGHIRFSLVTIPIRLYSATNRVRSVSFRQLHKDDHGTVKYVKRCRSCNDIVGKDDIVKGYEYEPDQYVVITEEELDNVKLKSTRVIEIEAFIDEKEVHPSYFEKLYFAGPDGEVASQAYNLLREALEQAKMVAVGKVVLREMENVMLIAPHKNGLLLYRLRYADELRDVNEVPDIEDGKVDADQLNMANTLIESLTKSFSDLDLKDDYRDSVMEMVEKKIAGKEVIIGADEGSDENVVDIMSALKASIEKSKKSGKKDKAKDKTKDKTSAEPEKKAG